MEKRIDGQAKFIINDFDYIFHKLVELDAVFLGASIEKTIRYDTFNDEY